MRRAQELPLPCAGVDVSRGLCLAWKQPAALQGHWQLGPGQVQGLWQAKNLVNAGGISTSIPRACAEDFLQLDVPSSS